MQRHILVTGFESNDGEMNASEVVVRSLERHSPPSVVASDCQFTWMILPGDTDRLKDVLYGKLAELAPAACLLLGQAPGRAKVTLERIGTNLRDFMVPDRQGNLECGSAIIEGAPAAYFGNFEITHVLRALHHCNVPCAPSNHAGNHLCNQALYLTLHYAHTKSRIPMAAIFMHIPLLPEQVQGRWVDQPTMPFSILREAVAAAALAIASHL